MSKPNDKSTQTDNFIPTKISDSAITVTTTTQPLVGEEKFKVSALKSQNYEQLRLKRTYEQMTEFGKHFDVVYNGELPEVFMKKLEDIMNDRV
jgi:hypothetical protein